MSIFKENKLLYSLILVFMIGYLIMTVISWGSLPADIRKPEFIPYLRHIGFFSFALYMILKENKFSNYAGFVLFNYHSWQAFVLIDKVISPGGIDLQDILISVDGFRTALLFCGTFMLWICVARRLKDSGDPGNTEQEA